MGTFPFFVMRNIETGNLGTQNRKSKNFKNIFAINNKKAHNYYINNNFLQDGWSS